MVSAEKFLLIPNKNSLKEAEELNYFGILYASGYSLPQDYKIALTYFRRAAKLEEGNALYYAGVWALAAGGKVLPVGRRI